MLQRFALLPRDGLFCKDGRGWYTSDVGRSRAHPWPLPATLRGALRAAFGRDVMERTGETLAPEAWQLRSEGVVILRMLTLRRPLAASFAPEHRRWPVPADALHVGNQREVARLVPSPPRRRDVGTLGGSDDPSVEALWRPRLLAGKPVAGPELWTDADMAAWLRGEPVARHAADDAERTPVRRTDIHLAIDRDTQSAVPSMLFSGEITEALARGGEWAIGLEIELPEEAPGVARGPILVGGRRRLAPVEALGPDVFDAPARLPGGSRGLRLVLVSPAEFDGGWLPDGFVSEGGSDGPIFTGTLSGVVERVVLRAALVPRPIALSTWDMVQRAPRATRRLVAPGSVYFFAKQSGAAFTAAEVRGLWLARLGQHKGEGLGLVLSGTWDFPNDGEA